MTEHDYLLAWSLYAVAALGCLLVAFRMTGWMWRFLREPIRVIVAVLLLTPTLVDPARDLLAPAIAIVALDLLFQVGSTSLAAFADLATYGVIALLAWLGYAVVRWPIESWWRARHAQPEQTAEEEPEPTLRELLARGPEDDYQPAARGSSRIEPRL